MMRHNVLYIYTDGSYFPKDRCGGWAALLWFNRKEKLVCGNEYNTSNQRMEVMAALKGLRAMQPGYTGEIVVVSDSQYLVDRMTRGWREMTSNEPELFMELEQFNQKYSITWERIKGHSDHPQNSRVDRIAKRKAFQLTEKEAL